MNSKTVSPSSNSLLWLMIGLSLGALPHFSYQPLWVTIIFTAMIAWRCMNIWHDWPLPSKQHRSMKWLQLGIACIAILLLLTSYGSLIGRDAGVALLTVMLGLKVVEIRSSRDYYLSCFLGYFLVVTNFFYSQSIPTAGLMFVVVLIMTTCLISMNDPKQVINTHSRLKLAGKMVLQAIPVMLLLFVFFPRIAGPLWGLPQDAYNSTTGIDDSMTLGKISQLILSDEVAFRVKFEGEIPRQSQLYWRGPILWNTDGTTWTELSKKNQFSTVPNIITSVTEYIYSVTLEPHNDHWLFALDLADKPPATPVSYLTHDGLLRSKDPIRQRVQYQLTSHTQFQFNADREANLASALQLPVDKHLRTRLLAEQWLQQTRQPRELVQLALNHFNQQQFYYTLMPPLLSGDTIDSFLFETRRGFCEHYAASFTILMRAVGVPTRIVTGYQGGEINPVNDFMIVRQRDAHAWTEVWIQGEGWLRVDPTASISKERIEQGINSIMPIGMRSPLFIANNQQLLELWQSIRNNWDALDNSWNQWILAYGPKLQKEFLSRLGMPSPDWQKMVVWLILSISIVLLIISMILFYQRKQLTPVARLYKNFCNKLARVGIKRHLNEGPLDFADRIKQNYPQHSTEINRITELYINLYYGNQSASIADLHNAVKQFQLQKS